MLRKLFQNREKKRPGPKCDGKKSWAEFYSSGQKNDRWGGIFPRNLRAIVKKKKRKRANREKTGARDGATIATFDKRWLKKVPRVKKKNSLKFSHKEEKRAIEGEKPKHSAK